MSKNRAVNIKHEEWVLGISAEALMTFLLTNRHSRSNVRRYPKTSRPSLSLGHSFSASFATDRRALRRCFTPAPQINPRSPTRVFKSMVNLLLKRSPEVMARASLARSTCRCFWGTMGYLSVGLPTFRGFVKCEVDIILVELYQLYIPNFWWLSNVFFIVAMVIVIFS